MRLSCALAGVDLPEFAQVSSSFAEIDDNISCYSAKVGHNEQREAGLRFPVQAGPHRRLWRRKIVSSAQIRGNAFESRHVSSMDRRCPARLIREVRCPRFSQDDSFTESFISTIGVDFVSKYDFLRASRRHALRSDWVSYEFDFVFLAAFPDRERGRQSR